MGCLPSPTPRMGCRELCFNLWTPDPRHRHHQPNTTHLDPSPLQEALAVAGDLSSLDFPSVDQLLWVRKGAVGRVGLWEGGAAQAPVADAPEVVPAGPPSCPFHPTFLSRSAPSSGLAVIEVAEQCTFFSLASVHEIEICKRDNVDVESEIHFAMAGVAHPVRPTTLWHLVNIAQRGGRSDPRRLWHGQSHAHVISRCACLCVCFLYWQIGRNSREIRTKSVPN